MLVTEFLCLVFDDNATLRESCCGRDNLKTPAAWVRQARIRRRRLLCTRIFTTRDASFPTNHLSLPIPFASLIHLSILSAFVPQAPTTTHINPEFSLKWQRRLWALQLEDQLVQRRWILPWRPITSNTRRPNPPQMRLVVRTQVSYSHHYPSPRACRPINSQATNSYSLQILSTRKLSPTLRCRTLLMRLALMHPLSARPLPLVIALYRALTSRSQPVRAKALSSTPNFPSVGSHQRNHHLYPMFHRGHCRR